MRYEFKFDEAISSILHVFEMREKPSAGIDNPHIRPAKISVCQ